MLVSKYSYWFLSVIIFFSCQKNLTQTDASTNIISQSTEATIQKSIVIDASSVSNYISSLSLTDSSVTRKIQDKMIHFYEANAFNTKWMNADSPDALYYAFIDRLKNASHYGLHAEAYSIAHIEQLVSNLYKNKSAASNDIINADLKITKIFFLFAIHLREGRINEPGHRGKTWITNQRQADYTDAMLLAAAKNSVAFDDVIKKLQPANAQYAKLQILLVHYRSLEKFEIALNVSARESIKPESKHVAMPSIRKKLLLMNTRISADERNDMDSLYYNEALVLSVKTFQQRHGLKQDGIIGG
jgi:murein L,D-transpeptidase YcbB/YkuD